MARDELLFDIIGERTAIIKIGDPEITAADIVAAGFVFVVGQLYKRMMHSYRNRFCRRGNGSYITARIAAAGESDGGFKFAVQRKVPGVGDIDGGAGFAESIGSLAHGPDTVGHILGIAYEKSGGIYQYFISFFFLCCKSSDGRLCEGFFYGTLFILISSAGTVAIVGLYQQELFAYFMKGNDLGAADQSTVKTDIVGAQSTG